MRKDPILVVDDNELNLKLAETVLARAGFEVRTAEDGADMWRVLEEFRPALILMDLQLPDVDGLELTRRLKADARTSGIVVVALTAYAMKGDDAKAKEAGCDGYIAKPIDTRSLGKTVAEYLQRAGGSTE